MSGRVSLIQLMRTIAMMRLSSLMEISNEKHPTLTISGLG